MTTFLQLEAIKTALAAGNAVEARRLRHELYVATLEAIARGSGWKTEQANGALKAENIGIPEENT